MLILDIALSHLTHRKRQSLVSILGAAMGVGFFIGISALMQGFQKDFVARVIDVQPHITIKDDVRTPPPQPAEMLFPNAAVALNGLKPREEVRGIRSSSAIMAMLDNMNGVTAAPVLSGQVLLRYGSKDASVGLTGIVPERERQVTTLEKDLLSGSLDSLYTTANAIIIGQGVAEKAGVAQGDIVSVISPEGIVLKMTVVAIFSSGITSVDNFETYTLLKKSQILQNRSNIVNGIRLRLDDIERADEIAGILESRFGYRAESWKEASRNVLSIFVIQNGIMYSTVGAILIVASFGIFNVISTVVFEKTRDIGILKSMGFDETDIKRIFMLEGLVVGVIGTILGWFLGWGIIEFLASLNFRTEGFVKAQGFILDRSPLHFVISGLSAIITSTFAAWLPARRAAKLKPVDIVRGST